MFTDMSQLNGQRPRRRQAERRDWEPERIKTAIRSSGLTLRQLSTLHGFNPAAVSQTLKRPWPAVELVVATHLGTEPFRIWPSRYRDGIPVYGRAQCRRRAA